MESSICTVEQLKTLTSVSQNIDCELLQPHLLIAQQLYVAPILGTALYTDIVNRYDNQTLTGDTQTLYEEYIIPAIGFCSWYSASPFLHMRTNRAGIHTQSASDGSTTPVTVEELSLYVTRVENYKNFYLNRLNDYLEDNKDTFTLFRDAQDVPVDSSTGGGLYLNFSTAAKKKCCKNWWES